MLVTLPTVLTSERLAFVRELLADGSFTSGQASAGEHARRHKHNEELVIADDRMDQLNNVVMGSLVQHPVYLNAGLPHRVALPYYSRYRQGMKYGLHVDDPVMGPAKSRYRCDVSITIFLSAPDEYEGGELIVHTDFGQQSVKLPAGDGIMYPASSQHEVRLVTWGERLAAVTWLQSLVPVAMHRELLYQLWLAREEMRQSAPEADSTRRVDHSYLNLVRMWTQL